MTPDYARIRRLLLMKSIMAVAGLLLVSLFYLYSLGRQQAITEQLFRHPFTVMQVSTQFRTDVISLRRSMLEVALNPETASEASWAAIRELDARIDASLAIMRKDFLGEQRHMAVIANELAAWRALRQRIRVAIAAGHPELARAAVVGAGKDNAENVLRESNAIIAFAQNRAQQFVAEGQSSLRQSRLIALSLMFLILLVYVLLAIKFRAVICEIFGRVEHDSLFDGLTGALNRIALIREGESELQRALRHGFPLSIVMLDLDHFKNVNDRHGHPAGDVVLQQFADICRRHLRDGDSLGRIGGEEFIILLPYAPCEGAKDVAERIRHEVQDATFDLDTVTRLAITVSVGVTCSVASDGTFAQLLRRADQALYQAKQDGRDRVCVV